MHFMYDHEIYTTVQLLIPYTDMHAIHIFTSIIPGYLNSNVIG